MKRVAKHGCELVRVPVILEPVVVPVPPLAIPDEIRDRAIAVRVAELYETSSKSPLFEYSQS